MEFIILNGSTGVGKSTLAKKLHKKYKMSYLLDVDDVRHGFSDFKENRERSRKISFAVSLSIVETCLENNTDVILDKMMYSNHDTFDETFVLEKFLELAKKNSAKIHEFIICSDKQVTLNRLSKRGYEEGGLNTPKKAEKHWEEMRLLKEERLQAVIIDSTNMTPDEVFDNVVRHIEYY